jgi:ribonucleotide reductase beta subunit family protein with ferritin-like domain
MCEAVFFFLPAAVFFFSFFFFFFFFNFYKISTYAKKIQFSNKDQLFHNQMFEKIFIFLP